MKKTNQFLIPPKILLRIDAVVFGIVGLVLLVAPQWTGANLSGEPMALASILRMLGCFMFFIVGAALVLASSPDRGTLERGALAFAAVFLLALLVFAAQGKAVWRASPGGGIVEGGFWFVLMLHSSWPSTSILSILWGRSKEEDSVNRLRSEWEIGIREAAGQEERHRLARDLHDSVKQQIFAIQSSVAAAQVRFDSDPGAAKAALQDARQLTRDASSEMNAMLDQLQANPLERKGLEAALRQQCEALEHRTGARVVFHSGSIPDVRQNSPTAHLNVFRVAQEALSNIARHARAKNVDVRLGGDSGDLVLTVDDDGSGFDPSVAGDGMGLRNMRSRVSEIGGFFLLRSGIGQGSTIEVRVPCVVPVSDERAHWALWGTCLVIGLLFSLIDLSWLGMAAAGLVGLAVQGVKSRRKAATR